MAEFKKYNTNIFESRQNEKLNVEVEMSRMLKKYNTDKGKGFTQRYDQFRHKKKKKKKKLQRRLSYYQDLTLEKNTIINNYNIL
jgi:hypothetical protein